MKVKLEKGDVLEVAVGEDGQEISVKVEVSYLDGFCTLDVTAPIADLDKSGMARFVQVTSHPGIVRMISFGPHPTSTPEDS